MSVITTVDERRESAKAHLSAAYADLLTILNESTHGNGDYTRDYMKGVHEVAMQLMLMKERI